MKKITLFLLIATSSVYCQERFTQGVSGEFSVENCDDCILEPGTVSFTIWVKQRREENALEKAKKSAVEAVLLKGIPGSAVSAPLISSTIYIQKKKWVDNFLNSNDCKNFVGKSTIVPEKTYKIKSGPFKNGYEAGIDIEVMYDNLKRYLTQNKIIKFGL